MGATEQVFLGQNDWGGGMNAQRPGENQYEEGVNIVIRDRRPTTRPGIRRRWRSGTQGFLPGFYFNTDNVQYNDGAHTGFWFPIYFSGAAWSAAVQGVAVIRFPTDEEDTILFAVGGAIYRHGAGFAETVLCTPALGATEVVTFVQANDYVYLFRGEEEATPPMRWDGTATGFAVVPDAGAGEDIPHATRGLYGADAYDAAAGAFGGRMWCFRDRDDVYASDILDFATWDYVYQMFGIRPGDGDELVRLWPFRDDILLCFKRKSVTALTGVNQVIGAGEHLSDFVQALVVDNEAGLVAVRGLVTVGEDVWYLGYGGIYSLKRNQQNRMERQAVAVSAPIQPLVDRINWSAVGCAAATIHENYVMFAVPLDESTVNNALLVYDLVAPAGDEGLVGAWVGLWECAGKILSVVEFFKIGESLLYLDTMGVVREMFVDVPSDTDEPYEDTPAYDADTYYLRGEVVAYTVDGVRGIYEAVKPGSGNLPTDGDYWEAVADPEHLYDISSRIRTRQYVLDGRHPPLRAGRGEILFRHQDPQVSVSMFSEDEGTSSALFSNVTYAQTEYDTAKTVDYAPESDAARILDPHRKDYTVKIGAAGLQIGAAGGKLGVWETHSLRFVKRLVNDRSFGFEIENTRGRLKLQVVGVPVQVRRYGAKTVV